MCANYGPVTNSDRMLTFFGTGCGPDHRPEVWPLEHAPFIRYTVEKARVVETGQFGLLPFFAKEVSYGRRTFNARSETVTSLPSFRDAWKDGQRCIVPAEQVFEPCYESGRAVRWRIRQPGDVPMGIAGIYRRWRGPDESEMLTFAMLTVSGEGHPVFQHMHKPGDEKRMVQILDPAEYDRWLQCSVDEAESFFGQWRGELDAFVAPLPPRASAAATDARPRAQVL